MKINTTYYKGITGFNSNLSYKNPCNNYYGPLFTIKVTGVHTSHTPLSTWDNNYSNTFDSIITLSYIGSSAGSVVNPNNQRLGSVYMIKG